MTTVLELLEASRVFELREALVAVCTAAFPECEVKAHPGRLDIGDLDKKDLFRAPSLAIAAIRLRPPDGRSSGLRDLTVEVAVYIVVEDMALGAPPRAFKRDEIGLALCDGVLALLDDESRARWGLADIGFPEEAQAQPLFTVLSFEQGTAYYAVTWRQTLYGLGSPFIPMEGPDPAPIDPITWLPGDPGYPPPEPGP
jgi:hypothetical protein